MTHIHAHLKNNSTPNSKRTQPHKSFGKIRRIATKKPKVSAAGPDPKLLGREIRPGHAARNP